MIQIKSYMGRYDVIFKDDFMFLSTITKGEKFVVCDKKVYTLYKNILNEFFNLNEIFLVEAVETKKNIDTSLEICRACTSFSSKKNLTLIAIGGGIIQDIAGFAANILYRGVDLVLVPTTLLSQADSCIGSKNSLNYENYKNLLGTFYPPKYVYICPLFLETLSNLDFNSGLGEIVKFYSISGYDNLRSLENNIEALLSRNSEVVKTFIKNSLNFKKAFIEEDEFDVSKRKLLNFAHTFGHAYEVLSNYAIPHGHAILLGIITANEVSVSRKLLSKELSKRIELICLKAYNAPSLCFDKTSEVIEIMKKDKKRTGNELTAVLMDRDFDLNVVQNINSNEVESAVSNLIALY